MVAPRAVVTVKVTVVDVVRTPVTSTVSASAQAARGATSGTRRHDFAVFASSAVGAGSIVSYEYERHPAVV